MISNGTAAPVNRRWLHLLGLLVTVVPARASADSDLSKSGTIVFSVDRLFGVGYATRDNAIPPELTSTGISSSDVVANVHLLWSLPVHGTGIDFAAIPRLSLDYFLVDHLSLGGSVGYVVSGGTSTFAQNGAEVEVDLPTVTAFGFAPRVGYGLAFNERFGLWTRLGFTYYHLSIEQTVAGNAPTGAVNRSRRTALDLDLDAMLVISPAEHFAFTLGPALAFTVDGQEDIITSFMGPAGSRDVSTLSLGLNLGLLGYF